jgi:hypothetical protein
VSEGIAKQTEVTVGDKRDADIMVSKGLSGGETLVLRPSDKLRDGGKVVEKAAAAK